MPTPYPLVDVAVVLITDPGRDEFLVTYNRRWGGFSFPMTKVGTRPGKTPDAPATPEPPEDAAVRAAVEVLGYPLPPSGRPVRLNFPVEPYQQGGRDGRWKRYNYLVFKLTAAATPLPPPGRAGVWVSRADLGTHAPVSPTVGLILAAVPPRAAGA